MSGMTAAYCRKNKGDLVLIAVFLLLSASLLLLDLGPEVPAASGRKVRARVLAVDNSEVESRGSMLSFGVQHLKLEILAGPERGEIHSAHNLLTGRTDIDKFFQPGDTALAAIHRDAEGAIQVHARDHYRLAPTLFLFGLFALLLLCFGGLTGLKALISFVFTCLVIWKVIVPLCLAGHNPIIVCLLAVSALCAGIIFIVAGVNAKGFTAFCGSFLGVLASCLMALFFTPLFRLNGAIMPYSQPLYFAGYGFLDLTALFIGAIFLASSGAVMDLAMDVAAGMEEVRRQSPAISRRELMKSGFRIGRMVVGTMTTTLLLAYSGGYLTLIMAFTAEGVGVTDFLNYPYVAAEVVKTIIGSFGLVLVAPFTALVGGLILCNRPLSGLSVPETDRA